MDIAKSLNIEARINELRDSLGEALRSRVVGPAMPWLMWW